MILVAGSSGLPAKGFDLKWRSYGGIATYRDRFERNTDQKIVPTWILRFATAVLWFATGLGPVANLKTAAANLKFQIANLKIQVGTIVWLISD